MGCQIRGLYKGMTNVFPELNSSEGGTHVAHKLPGVGAVLERKGSPFGAADGIATGAQRRATVLSLSVCASRSRPARCDGRGRGVRRLRPRAADGRPRTASSYPPFTPITAGWVSGIFTWGSQRKLTNLVSTERIQRAIHAFVFYQGIAHLNSHNSGFY